MEENLKGLLEERKRLELRLERVNEKLERDIAAIKADDEKAYRTSDYVSSIRHSSITKEVEEETRKKAEAEIKEINDSIDSHNMKIGAELREIRDRLLREIAPVEKELNELKPQLEEAEALYKEEYAKVNAARIRAYREGDFAEPDLSAMNSAKEKMDALKQKAESLENTISEKQARIDNINQFFGTIRVKDTKVEDIEKIALSGKEKEEKPSEQEKPVEEQAKQETVETAETKAVVTEEVSTEEGQAATRRRFIPRSLSPEPRTAVKESEVAPLTEQETAETPTKPIEIEAEPIDIVISGTGIEYGDEKIGYKEYMDNFSDKGFNDLKDLLVGNIEKERLKVFSWGDPRVITSLWMAARSNKDLRTKIKKLPEAQRETVAKEAATKLFASYINDYYELMEDPSKKENSPISITYDLRSKSMPNRFMAWIKKDTLAPEFASEVKSEAWWARDYATVKHGPITKLQFMIKEGIEKAKQKRLERASETERQEGEVESEKPETVSPEKTEKAPSWQLSEEEKAAAVKGAEQHAQEAKAETPTPSKPKREPIKWADEPEEEVK